MGYESPTTTSTTNWTGDGSAKTVTLGYKPSHVIVWNATDAVRWEKVLTQADADAIKTVTGGTTTNDTGSAIVLSSTGFTFSATANVNAKAFHMVAFR